jgi:hypothetical protein
MPKLSILPEGSKTTHELTGERVTSERPADFTNASPFPNRQKEKDPAATAILAAGALAILAFLISMLGLLQIHGPL